MTPSSRGGKAGGVVRDSAVHGRWYRYGYACVGFGRPLSLREHLRERGIDLRHVHIPRQDQEYAVGVGLRMLLLRRMVVLNSGVYRANPNEHALLTYYGNAIAHLWARTGAFEGALLTPVPVSQQA